MRIERTVTHRYEVTSPTTEPIFKFKDFVTSRLKHGMSISKFKSCFVCKKPFKDEDNVYFATVTPKIGNRFVCKDCIKKIVVTSLSLLLLGSTFTKAERLSFPIVSEIKQLDWDSDSSAYYVDRKTGIWSIGKTATIIDVQTGIYFIAYRHFGTNHVDWEPYTKEDTAKLRELYPKKSWDRRPVVVIIGKEAFAASINGMPHGTDDIEGKDYEGHSCCHFLNSKLHCAWKCDEEHQKAVLTAFNTDVKTLYLLMLKQAISEDLKGKIFSPMEVLK